MMSTTFGFPSVIVPVLSRTIVLIRCAFSRISAFFINKPFSAPFPVPTIIATGVASPNAQGQAITKTDIAKLNANSKLSPIHKEIIKVKIAMLMITGTNILDILSTNLEIGALELLASSTNLMIVLIDESSPTRLALILI